MERRLGKSLKKHNLLITFHPETTSSNSIKHFKNLLKALEDLRDTLLIFTKSNTDAEGKKINKLIDEYVSQKQDKAVVFTNMGQLFYLSTMKYVDAVVGNSSSGIIEAASFKVSTINIGSRQEGREKAKSVIDTSPDYKSIKKALKLALSKEFKLFLKDVKNPYEGQNTSEKIKETLKNFDLSIPVKKFYDMECKNG